MATEPSGVGVYSPKIRDAALVRKFVSLGGRGYVAISIQDGATSVDPDPDTLQLAIWFRDVSGSEPTNPYGIQTTVVTADSITKDSTGHYYYYLGPEVTSNRGLITVVWSYAVNGETFSFTDHLQVLDPMPLYDSLSEQERSTVEQVSWMFGDLYDSTEGGPHLIEEFQTHWGYERIAQLMAIAVARMNLIGNYANPPTTWTVGHGGVGSSSSNQQVTEVTRPDGSTLLMYSTSGGSSAGGSAVPGAFAGLVVLGTYIEVLRHLRDSYTEIPNRPGMDVTFTDRRDYWNRWTANLQYEQQNWEMMVRKAKMSLLNLSRGSLLVAGGIYGGSSGGLFQVGTYAAQVRAWRFYPAAPAISWGATRH